MTDFFYYFYELFYEFVNPPVLRLYEIVFFKILSNSHFYQFLLCKNFVFLQKTIL